MSDEKRDELESQSNIEPASDTNSANESSVELSEDELNNVSGGGRKAGKGQQEFLVVKLEEVFISGVQ